MNESIEKLWCRILDGDYSAWSQLVVQFSPLVLTVARKCGLSTEDAEDCGQHTWLMLHRHRHRLSDPLRLPAWLVQTTRRRAMRLHSQADRRQLLESSSSAPEAPPAPDEIFLQLERRAVLELALDHIDPRCGKLLRALFFSDDSKTYSDIAKSLGVTPNAFGPLRSRCLARLKKILLEMGYTLD